MNKWKRGRTQEQRFMDRVVKQPDGCWRWAGAVHDSGYGSLSPDFYPRAPHRWSYTHFIGPIPEGLEIDHTCHDVTCIGGTQCLHRRCVNPAHLAAVTHLVNIQRSRVGIFERSKTHCPANHEYTEANTYRTGPSKRKRMCRTCSLTRSNARNQRLRLEAVSS